MKHARVALIAALVWCAPALAEKAHPTCDRIVQPEVLAEHSHHPWRNGAPIRIPRDVAVCNYYQDEVPGGLSLAVRDDPDGKDFKHAREIHARDAQDAGDSKDAFYFRLRTEAPFEPSWGMVVHADSRTYQLEGVPEADNAEAARKLAKEIVERSMQAF